MNRSTQATGFDLSLEAGEYESPRRIDGEDLKRWMGNYRQYNRDLDTEGIIAALEGKTVQWKRSFGIFRIKGK